MEIISFNISKKLKRTKKSINPLLEYHSFTAWLRPTIRDDPFLRASCVRFLDSNIVLSRLTDRELLRISSRFYICIFIAIVQKSQEVSRVQPPAKWAEHPAVSADTPIPTTAESTTYVWKVSRESTDALSALCSRSVMPMAAVPAKILRTFLDGESNLSISLLYQRFSESFYIRDISYFLVTRCKKKKKYSKKSHFEGRM